MKSGRRIRVLMAKPGLDGHDRGVKVVIHALRDAGMEVIYSGLRQTVDQIAAVAAQENVDVIGLSVLSGSYMGIARRMAERMREAGLEDCLLILGGNILARHVEELRALGVAEVFNHHADMAEVVSYIRENAGRARGRPPAF